MQISSAVGYFIEGAKLCDEEEQEAPKNESEEIIDEIFDLSDSDYRYYREHFFEKNHQNFLSSDAANPMSISVVKNGESSKYRALVRTKDGNFRKEVPTTDIHNTFLRRLLGKEPISKAVLKAIDPSLPVSKLKSVNDPRVPQALLNLEEKQTIKGFKFGVLYCAPGQTKEDEMFSNVESSAEFEEFLDFLGERVELNGWNRYRAGLDVTNGSTGEHSIFTEWHNNEIMYHVSTLLPFNPSDKQQLERKRHIGNDIVVVMFIEGDQVYRPTTISSRQIHVVILIKPEMVEGERYYRMAVISREGVPKFAPTLPSDAIFRKDDEFRDLFYSKLLNAERACYKAPMLDSKLTRTRSALLKDLSDQYLS